MGDRTHIEWTDATWNPVRGCTKVSAGCDNCYAMTMAGRFSGPGQPYDGLTRKVNGRHQWNGDIMLVPEKLDQPLRWTKPRRIFVNSMSDLFHPGVPDDFIDQVFAVMALARHHVFQVLTKRPERMREYLRQLSEQQLWKLRLREASGQSLRYGPTSRYPDWPLPNVWLGTSVDDQATADERIPHLLDTPAAVRWISAEPLLGPVNLREVWARMPSGGQSLTDSLRDGLDWVVVGGESGPGARPMHPDWARSLRDQCAEAGAPFLFKQWGDWAGSVLTMHCHAAEGGASGLKHTVEGVRHPFVVYADGQVSARVGKKVAGRELDGRTHDEYPEAA